MGLEFGEVQERRGAGQGAVQGHHPEAAGAGELDLRGVEILVEMQAQFFGQVLHAGAAVEEFQVAGAGRAGGAVPHGHVPAGGQKPAGHGFHHRGVGGDGPLRGERAGQVGLEINGAVRGEKGLPAPEELQGLGQGPVDLNGLVGQAGDQGHGRRGHRRGLKGIAGRRRDFRGIFHG